MKLDDKLTFGKYKGYAIREVIRKDPDYVAWACDEDIIELDEEAEWLLDFTLFDED